MPRVRPVSFSTGAAPAPSPQVQHRLSLAHQLSQSGSSTDPVGGIPEGLARLAQGALGGLTARRAMALQEEEERERREAMSEALRKLGGESATLTTSPVVDGGLSRPTDVPASDINVQTSPDVLSVLAGVPGMQEMALQMQLARLLEGESEPQFVEDATGVKRWVTGPQAGQQVFPGVTPPAAKSDARSPERMAQDLALAQLRLQGQLEGRVAAAQAIRQDEESSARGQAQTERAVAEAEKVRRELDALDRDERKEVKFRNETLDVVNDILSDDTRPALEAATGAIQGRSPDIIAAGISQLDQKSATPEQVRNVRNKITRLKGMMTKENLGMLSGVLSDSDMALLTQISAGEIDLLTESGTIEALERIKADLESANIATPSALPGATAAPSPVAETYSEGDILTNAQGERIILRNGAWVPL